MFFVFSLPVCLQKKKNELQHEQKKTSLSLSLVSLNPTFFTSLSLSLAKALFGGLVVFVVVWGEKACKSKKQLSSTRAAANDER